ncbi:MAG: hypothetical protein KJT01_10450 [Gemmatimonadetes bacterium]|nr:hypothetical protein [Gemmatimonadota bacterium]
MLSAALLPVAGVFTVGVLIGLVLLLTGEPIITAVARSVAEDVSKAFWTGVLWQLLAGPILAVMALACAITIVGIFAIPVVVLAWMLAYAGAFTLGFMAVGVVVGRAVGGRLGARTERGAAWRALVLGLLLLMLPWVAAAEAGWWGRLAAASFTWAVASVGLGAVVRSRLGVATFTFQRMSGGVVGRWTASTGRAPSAGAGWPAPERPRDPNEVARVEWDTPTPVQGVVAARRPASAEDGGAGG